jgi:hypothetical protein
MSRTEERLADALHASADRVRYDRLRPFPALGPDAGAGTSHRAAWRTWLVPVAAAASVALIIGLAVAVTRGSQQGRPGPASGPGATAVPFPKYFAEDTYLGGGAGDVVQVRSTSTGSVVASARTPTVAGWSLDVYAEGAGPGGRTFYLAYMATRDVGSSTTRVLIYRLSITSSGAAMPLTPIKGGAITVANTSGYDAGSLAVSPDGSKLALNLDDTNQDDQSAADKIVVIDVPTGAQHAWRGGLYRSGKSFSIPQISWTADSRSLVFLGVWCGIPRQSPGCSGPSGPGGSRYTQIRSINVATGGGTLDHSVVLLAQSARYPVIASALAGPGPAELDVVVLYGTMSSAGSWSNAKVERVSAVNGALLGVAYRWVGHGNEGLSVGIGSDSSGRYVLFYYYSGQGSYYTGWIAGGKLHLLPIKQPRSEDMIIAW